MAKEPASVPELGDEAHIHAEMLSNCAKHLLDLFVDGATSVG
jgi:hypothetical protein